MQFLIVDSFTDSLVRLTNDEQKAVKTTAFDLQLNPAKPGRKLHKLDKVSIKNCFAVTVEITAEIPNGVKDDVKRNVSENAVSLRFVQSDWD